MTSAFTGREFVKMHGLRNHFVIIDARRQALQPRAEDVVQVCDVQVGVGADQLIVIEAPQDGKADAFMRIYNMDGREAEACGNATRCVAWQLLEEQGGEQVVIETRAGALLCERVGEQRVRCEMGRVSMAWQRIPLDAERDTLHLGLESGPLSDPAAVNVGNPHAVFFVDDLGKVDVKQWAPAVQRHPWFPNQVNVGVAQLVHRSRLRLVVYERGAGLTTACGSGACAAVFAARARGLTDSRGMDVMLPGGTVRIDIGENDMALMTGPVEYCFAGRL